MKVIIADKQPVYRDGIKHNLEKTHPSVMVFNASSLEQINDILRRNNDVELILTDMDIIQPDWESKIREWLNVFYVPKIGLMSDKHNILDCQKAQHSGLYCYFPKNIETETLKKVLSSVLGGKTCYPSITSNEENIDNNKKLTPRQFEVLKYLSQGLSNKQIAYQMNVSEATVKLHINALLRTIQATNRTQAVVKSQRLGLV